MRGCRAGSGGSANAALKVVFRASSAIISSLIVRNIAKRGNTYFPDAETRDSLRGQPDHITSLTELGIWRLRLSLSFRLPANDSDGAESSNDESPSATNPGRRWDSPVVSPPTFARALLTSRITQTGSRRILDPSRRSSIRMFADGGDAGSCSTVGTRAADNRAARESDRSASGRSAYLPRVGRLLDRRVEGVAADDARPGRRR